MEQPKEYRYYRSTRPCIPRSEWPEDCRKYALWECDIRKHPEWKTLTDDEWMVARQKQKAEDLKKRIEGTKRRWAEMKASMTPDQLHDEMQRRSNTFWGGMDEGEKKKFSAYRESCWTDEQKEIRRRQGSEKLAKYRESLTDEDINRDVKRINAARKKKREENPEWAAEQDRLLRIHNAEYHSNLTPEQRAAISQRVSDRWANLSDEERARLGKILSERNYRWWASRTPEQLQAISDRMTKWNDNFWNEDNKRFSTNTSKLNDAFADMFHRSILDQTFYIEPEYRSVNETRHKWDFGVINKSTKQLVALVDVDGSYFHADECDYNGMQSSEEYDEKRFLSVNDPKVKIFIIHENTMRKDFEFFFNEVVIEYEEFIEKIFKECRRIPFPNPKYNISDLIHSFQSLKRMNCSDKYHQDISLNTRLGDHLIQHFHESIYSAHRKGDISPREAWYNDDLLRKVIKNRTIYQTTLNPNKILQGFNVSKVAQKVSVFSAGRAKMIINRYLIEFDTIFDPFSGFSGRMLGAISLGKDYLGQDISEIHVRESNKIIDFLRKCGYSINAEVIQEDILHSYGTYPCLFTCPPYGDKEQWLEVPPDKRTCDDWIDICLEHFKCHRYVFVVDHTEKYKEYVVEEIQNRSHFNKNSEWIVVIDK